MNTLNYSFRYLANRRGNTLARFVSLSLGLLVALLIFSYVGFNLSFDRCFPDRDRIYAVWRHSPHTGYSPWIPYPLSEALATEMPQIDCFCDVRQNGHDQFKYKDNIFESKYGCEIAITPNTFFDLFGINLISGDPQQLLNSINNILISERMAKQLFGKDDPLGKTLKGTYYRSNREVTVCGVYKTIPANTSLGEFDYIFHSPLLKEYEGHPVDYWGICSKAYLKLRKDAKIEDVERNLEVIAERFSKYNNVEDKFILIPLKDNYFLDNNIRQTQALLSIVGILALLVACLNYVLLSISSLTERSRTIAMLRCHGAQKSDIFLLFLVETLIIVSAATAWTAFMIWALDKEIFQLTGYHNEVLFAWERIWIPSLVCIAAFSLSGLIPACLFAMVKLSRAFRSGSDNYRLWKRCLLFVQITCTVAAVIFLSVCLRQMHYVQTVDFGFNRKNLFSIMLMSSSTSGILAIKDDIQKYHAIEAVSTSSAGFHIVTAEEDKTNGYYVNEKREFVFPFILTTMDHASFKIFDIELLEGRIFAKDEPPINYQDDYTVHPILINESFKKKMGCKESPIGQLINLGNYDYGDIRPNPYRIIGVVKDFYFGKGFIQPMVIENGTFNPNEEIGLTRSDGVKVFGSSLLMRFKDGYNKKDIEYIEKLIKEHPSSSAEERFFDEVINVEDQFKKQYEGERKVSITMLAVCVITLIIALSGLIGYMDNEMQRRRKEIAIRKVAGATVGEVMVMIAADLLWVTIPATAFGIVIAYMAGSEWLQTITGMRAPLSWWIFAAGATLVLAVIYAIQIARTWHTATANPIEMIKQE